MPPLFPFGEVDAGGREILPGSEYFAREDAALAV